ncbi:MAG: hypothetical protein WC838_03725 [Candidatus Margulisiibacteriota bacterium]
MTENKKGILAKLWEKLDQSLKSKAETKGACCCSEDKKDKGNGPCCKK